MMFEQEHIDSVGKELQHLRWRSGMSIRLHDAVPNQMNALQLNASEWHPPS